MSEDADNFYNKSNTYTDGQQAASVKEINVVNETIRTNTISEMVIKNDRNFSIKMHKDPYVEAKLYLAKNDVYELFKNLTVNLVLKKPRDPIKNMIEKLREVHEAEVKKKAIKIQQQQLALKGAQQQSNNSSNQTTKLESNTEKGTE